MNRLFLKILAWFWLTILLVSAALVFVIMAALPVPIDRPFDPARESTQLLHRGLRRNLRSLVNQYEENDGIDGNSRRAQFIRNLYLFNSAGSEITGKNVIPSPVSNLARSLRESEEPVVFQPPWFGIRIESDSGSRYESILRSSNLMRMRAQMSPYDRFKLAAYDNLTREMLLSLFGVILLAGLFCFILARHLTTPVSRLRDVTRELRKGNLSARVGGMIGNRKDEIADLAEDFDLMAERIEELVTSQIRLIRDVSHEFRSPLARLNVALELARSSSEENRGPALDRIERESECLNDLIEQLLTLARMESGKVEAERVPVDLGRILTDIAADARYESAGKGVEVDLEYQKEAVLYGYERLLYSALENVVRNATLHTAENTNVAISLEKEGAGKGEFFRIVVRDHGRGIPESELGRVFTPFYRLAPSRDRISGGAGIGLAITDRVVKLHNGSVKASNHPEGGLQIVIRLPIQENHGS